MSVGSRFSHAFQQCKGRTLPVWAAGLSFFLIEVFAFAFLGFDADETVFSILTVPEGHSVMERIWPVVFGALWALVLTGLVYALPGTAARIAYGIFYYLGVVYAAVQTGYYLLFGQMLWLSEFRYASEGSDYFSVLLRYPIGWWLGIAALVLLGIGVLRHFPRRKPGTVRVVLSLLLSAVAVCGAAALPKVVFLQDRSIRYAGSDYGRMQSAEAAYTNMFSPHRLYRVCGLYQSLVKDTYANYLFPLTPGYASAQRAARQEINAYFERRPAHQNNDMTGIFAGKNVVLVLMESMDDWMIGENTPTITRMMEEGICFTDFYTPGYGGVRTFNSEFCMNTGSFLSSQGGYAFDYVTNDYRQSLASLLRDQGYSALTYHYNDPNFYSRGVFSPAMGYEAYVCYEDYISGEDEELLYDDQLLFDNDALSESFFREGPKLNFIITRSAHLSYVYNEVLSHWALKQYPEYKGLTGHEEVDCAFLKAKLVDELFARLLQELEAHGELDNTVIIAMTDHYTYGVQDTDMLLERSGVTEELLLEKTPLFIWSADCPDLAVSKTMQTADVLPTVLNLLGVESPFPYVGQDVFDPDYPGYALFPDGSWICGGSAFDASQELLLPLQPEAPAVSEEFFARMNEICEAFIRVNNQILETNYYHK